MKSFKNQTKPFDFFQELNGREIMHWIGTPCFVKERSKKDEDLVTIVTIDGYVYFEIKSADLESMDPGDLALFV
jgi:hypothetical protein